MSFICLYHRTKRTDTSVEDILQKAFGGKKTSSALICSRCNNHLGSTIDKALAESLEWVTTLVNPVGRRRAPATLKNVPDQDGTNWHIEPGGKPTVPYQQIAPTTWKGDLSQIEMAKRNAEAKALALGIEEPVIEVRHERTQAAPIAFELKLENEIAFRSACKSALELLALIGLDDSDRESDLLLSARRFVMEGTPYSDVGWLETSILTMESNAFEHYILLVQSDDFSVYWEFVLYGGVIAVSGRFAPIKKKLGAYMYRVCPRTGKVFDSAIELQVSEDLVTWSTVTTIPLTQRTNSALQKINFAVITNSVLDDLPEDFEQLDSIKQNEYLLMASNQIIEGAVSAISTATGRSPMEVLKTIYKNMASDTRNANEHPITDSSGSA